MTKKLKYPNQSYIKEILKKYPNVASGRYNYKFFFERIKKNINLTRKYFKKNS